MAAERGQATIEWVGLILIVALALGALLKLAPGAEGRRLLGHTLAHGLTCAAAARCQAGPSEGDANAGYSPDLQARAPANALGQRLASERTRPVDVAPRRIEAARVAPDRAAAAMHALRGVRRLARRAWVLCLGWKRYRYERAHPEVTIPGRGMPVREALRIANQCLNPVLFVAEERAP